MDGVTPQRITLPFPMVRRIRRRPAGDYRGLVFVSDVDQTYLDTAFHGTREMLRVALEPATHKATMEGMVELLRGLRVRPRDEPVPPLYFVTASPPQMARTLEERMRLDGLDPDGVTYKDQLQLVRKLRLDRLRRHIGFKLSALLLLYREMPGNTRFVLFGDDTERDPLIYSLFADVSSGRMRSALLFDTLRSVGVLPRVAREIRVLADELPRRDAIERAYIRLVKSPSGDTLNRASQHLRGYTTSLAAAEDLASIGHLGEEGLDLVRRASSSGDLIRGRREPDVAHFWTPPYFRTM